MKRITPLFLLFFVLAAATGCQKDTNEQLPVPAPAASRLERLTLGDDLLQLSYNTDGSLKEAIVKNEMASGGDLVTFRISYTAPGKIKEVTTDDGRRIIPEYDGNQVIQATVRNLANQVVARTEYTYLNGFLKSATLHFSNGTMTVPMLRYLFTYTAGGNVQKTQLLVNDLINNQLVPAGEIRYEYDDRANPLLPVKDFLLLIWQAVSPNNIKREVQVGEQNTIDETRVYEYSYNARNQPQSAKVTKAITGMPVENLAMVFSYR